jgi:hypothetical protein
MNRTVKIVLGILVVVIIAGGSFYGGMVYGKSQAQTALPNFEGMAGMPGMAGQGGTRPSGQSGSNSGRGGMLSGEIVSINGGDVTLKDTSGQEIVVHVTNTTLIQEQAEVTVDALAAGDTMFVSGTKGDDGSYTARSVQVSSGSLGMPGSFPGGGQPGPDAATPIP